MKIFLLTRTLAELGEVHRCVVMAHNARLARDRVLRSAGVEGPSAWNGAVCEELGAANINVAQRIPAGESFLVAKERAS